MASIVLLPSVPRARTLAWWLLASVAAHVLLMQWLPGWQLAGDKAPPPLQVELRQPPASPEIIPPKPLPVEARPQVRPKPLPEKPALTPREQPAPVAQPASLPAAPVLAVPPEAPAAPQAPVVAEPKPAPPPPAPEPPRAPPPAPITPPRFDATPTGNPEPPYPLAARRRGEQGSVTLRLTVTIDGHAKNVVVEKSSGFASLDNAAADYAKTHWRFQPARQNGQPVEHTYTRVVTFKLE